MPLERSKVLKWWAGAVTNDELGAWSGMAPRAVEIVLGLPFIGSHVKGRGRGSKRSRRVLGKARCGVAMVQTLSRAGLTFELGVNILGAVPTVASHVEETIDWSPLPLSMPMCALAEVDPDGEWQPLELVRRHLWDLEVYDCRSVDDDNPSPGSIYKIPVADWEPNTDSNTMNTGRVELVRMSDVPRYQGEVDPFGIYEADWRSDVAIPSLDDHLLIVDGRWVFHRRPDPDPTEVLQDRYDGDMSYRSTENQKYWEHLVAEISDDRRTVRMIAYGDDAEPIAERARENAESILDVNVTLAARRMKRRAYGLP